MTSTLEDFQDGFSIHLSVKEVTEPVSYPWKFGPYQKKNVPEVCAFFIRAIFQGKEEGYNYLGRRINPNRKYKFAIIITNRTGDKKRSFILKPPISHGNSKKFEYYYFYTAVELYRQFGDDRPLKVPVWFMNMYSGLSTTPNTAATNPTEIEQKRIPIKRPSKIVRK